MNVHIDVKNKKMYWSKPDRSADKVKIKVTFIYTSPFITNKAEQSVVEYKRNH